VICFPPSLADSFIFLTLTRLVVVIIFENFSFSLFTPPPLGDYHEAVLDFCRVLGSGDVPSGSSPQSRLEALGDHVRGRLREALHHGVRRAFTVLASHYVVDLERVSEGYCLPDEDEAALAKVQRLDAAAAGPSAVLATTFEAEILPPAPSSETGMDFADGGDKAEGVAPSRGDA
jgi:hypothetical protein